MPSAVTPRRRRNSFKRVADAFLWPTGGPGWSARGPECPLVDWVRGGLAADSPRPMPTSRDGHPAPHLAHRRATPASGQRRRARAGASIRGGHAPRTRPRRRANRGNGPREARALKNQMLEVRTCSPYPVGF